MHFYLDDCLLPEVIFHWHHSNSFADLRENKLTIDGVDCESVFLRHELVFEDHKSALRVPYSQPFAKSPKGHDRLMQNFNLDSVAIVERSVPVE